MTLRQRQMARPRRRTFMHGEDRQQFYVTVLFVGLIGLLVFFLVAAVGLAFYNENIRPVARVGDVEIGPGMVRERAALLRNRIQIEENQLTPAVIDGEIDATRAAQRRTELDNQRNELGVVSVEGLIDIIFQSQLAAEMGIDVTDEEVEARLADEVATLERRQVLAIFVEPQAADEDERPPPPHPPPPRRAPAASGLVAPLDDRQHFLGLLFQQLATGCLDVQPEQRLGI
jgi:hypothetical protein